MNDVPAPVTPIPSAPKGEGKPDGEPPPEQHDLPSAGFLSNLEMVVCLVGLGLMVFVALNPDGEYRQTPKVILLFLAAMVPAVLFGSKTAARLKWTLGSFAGVVSGLGAFFLAMVLVLNHLASPGEAIAVFHIIDQDSNAISLETAGALEITSRGSAMTPTYYRQGNTLVAIFFGQVDEAQIVVRYGGQRYHGVIKYDGAARSSSLRLGEHLVLVPPGGTGK